MASTQVVEEHPATGDSPLTGAITLLSDPNAGAVHALDKGELVIGRAPDVSLPIDDAGLSRRHARIYHHGGRYFVEDLGSTNGTTVGGVCIEGPVELIEGTRILLGKSTILRFSLQDRLEQEAARRAYEQTVRDALTGLYNRRYLEDRLQTEFAYSQRHGAPLGLMVIDADHFKQINDSHGHPAGDAVLRVLGTTLERLIRMEDMAARYGGEEFVVLARGVGGEGSAALAERIRSQVAAQPVVYEGVSIAVTVSIGVAATDRHYHQSAAAMLAAADRALYRAKENGRNRIECA